MEQRAWTAEQAAVRLDVSIATSYRYLLALEVVGLIAATSTGRDVLGPVIIELDRQIQLTDPLLMAARGVMTDLVGYAPGSTAVLLCRSFSDKVLYMHQLLSAGPPPAVSYDRRRPMPLFRGATSKQSWRSCRRALKSLYLAHIDAARKAGLDADWNAFRAAMAALRKTGSAIGTAEVVLGVTGIGVPVLNSERHTVGSLRYVVPGSTEPRLASLLQTGAREFEAALAGPHTRARLSRTGSRSGKSLATTDLRARPKVGDENRFRPQPRIEQSIQEWNTVFLWYCFETVEIAANVWLFCVQQRSHRAVGVTHDCGPVKFNQQEPTCPNSGNQFKSAASI